MVECGGEDTFLPESCVNVLVQGRFMKEADKENFLSAFYEELPEGASLAGFCVLGGIFSEGIDLRMRALSELSLLELGFRWCAGSVTF